jgi:murein DD-endopeptidase MepM/ murein hydrolase activator NlpD
VFGKHGARSGPAGRHHRGGQRPARTAIPTLVSTFSAAVAALRGRARSAAHRAPELVDAVRRPRRQTAVATLTLAAVGLTTAGGVAGIGAGVESAAAAHPVAVTAIDPVDRVAAAQRADRSARPALPPAVPATPATPAKPAPPKKKPAWVAPMTTFELSSCFGPRWGVMHQGIDFAMPAGTIIRAAGAGTVLAAGWTFAGYGISVVIDHGNGYLTHYAHASKVWVRPGQRVKPGQALAREGSTGDSTGPHLHFEVHKGAMWHQIDPAKFLRARGVKIGC